MRTYIVYVRDPLTGGAREIAAVEQGFSPVWALFAAPLAALHGHWPAAACYVSALIAASVIAGLFEGPAAGAVIFGFAVLQGLTAADVRGWALGLTGHRIEAWGAWPNADAAIEAVLAADPALAADMAAALGFSGAGASA